MDYHSFKIGVKDLARQCDPAVFNFKSTADLEPLPGIIGQERAIRSLGFGLDISNKDYNIYLSGAFGTGKTTLTRQMLEEKARRKSPPPDWCYVYNFKDLDCPRALQLPAGLGRVFKKNIRDTVDVVLKNISQAFEGEAFELQKNSLLNEFMEENNQLFMRLEEESRNYGFSISRAQNWITSVPLKDSGEPMNKDEFLALAEEEREELMKKNSLVQEKINESYRQYRLLEKSVKEKLKELELNTAREVTEPKFQELYQAYSPYSEVVSYLKEMQEDILNNLELLVHEEENSPLNFLRRMDKRAVLRRYQVNLIVDNSGLDHAPVVFETNPTYAKLFGQIEFAIEFGILSTDFSKIRAGSVHRANGGYLVLYVNDILKEYYLWEKLKRVIKNKEIVVESLSKSMGLGNSETLQPDSIKLDIKVVLIGDPRYYFLLYEYDEEFKRLFKIRADFDTQIQRNDNNIQNYAHLISSICYRAGLKHFSPGAVAKVVDYGSRLTGDQRKLSTLFDSLVEIACEADHWATLDRTETIKPQHVKKAIQEKRYRSSMLEEKLHDHIIEDTLMINVVDHRIGEINGLAVYELGGYRFGKPVRITAKTFMGEKGLVNIEREIRLSGSIHSKGVLTLNGYLGSQYAQDKPLSLSASLTFEQSYSGIEGDSASSAELYALLSSLAELPLNQGVAVTGSVNQNGEIQAVGGVNEKIEGFFAVCQSKGLNGKQGVIIPRQNVANLMLGEEVIKAVQEGKFTIWAIDHIDQGIKILTGIPAGQADERGQFPTDSLHYRVDQKLRKWSKKNITGLPGGIGISFSKWVTRRRRKG